MTPNIQIFLGSLIRDKYVGLGSFDGDAREFASIEQRHYIKSRARVLLHNPPPTLN